MRCFIVAGRAPFFWRDPLNTWRVFASVARSCARRWRSAPSSPGVAFFCWSRADGPRRHQLPELRVDEEVEQRAVHVAGPSLIAQDVERLVAGDAALVRARSEEHTSELQSLT